MTGLSKHTLLALLAALALGLSACGQSEDAETADEPEAAAQDSAADEPATGEPAAEEPAAEAPAGAPGDVVPAEADMPALTEFELIERALFFDNPSRVQGQISPDGSKISFAAPVDGVMNIWVGPADDFESAEPITDDKARGITAHAWAANGTHVLYLRDEGGNENFHVFAVNLETDETQNLTPFENTRAIFVGGSYRKPDEFLIGLNNRDPRWHDVYRINVVTGEREMIEENNSFGSFVADEDLNLRLATQPRQDGGQTVFKKDEAGEWTEFFVIDKDDALTSTPLSFTASGNAFYMLDSKDRNTAALVRVDYDTGERTVLAENERADVGRVLFDPQTNEPLAYAVNYKRTTWTPLDRTVSNDLATLRRELPGDFAVVSQTKDNMTWFVADDSATKPLTYYSFDRETGRLSPLFAARPELEGKPLNEMHPVVIESRDGLELVSYLTLPPNVDVDGNAIPAKPVPLVLNVHGGPWARDSYGYDSWAQWLSNRGYAVLQVNFRASTGFGKDFINAGDKEWGRKMHDDLIDAVQWAIDEGITTADQVSIAGGSYGGYAALAGLTFTPETFTCGVSIVGPSNLVTLLNSIPPYWTSFLETFAQRVGDPRTEEGQALLTERSPLFKADEITKPLLIGQGANDPRVKQAESDQIVEAMRKNGLPVTYVLYPDEGHGFARPQNRLAFYAVMESFLGECLGGRVEPFGDALAGSSTTVPEGAQHIPGLEAALDGFEPQVKK